MLPLRLVFPAVALVVVGAPPDSQCIEMLVESGGQAGSNFGVGWLDTDDAGICIDGESMIVGASDPLHNVPGSATIFEKDGAGWTEVASFANDNGGLNDHFGTAVSIRGDVAAVGAFSDGMQGFFEAGSVTVLRRAGSTWVEEQLLRAGSPKVKGHFGRSVAVGEDAIFVASHSELLWDQQEVSVFKWNGASWVEEQVIPEPPESSVWFASCLATEGDVLAVGAGLHTVVHVYREAGGEWVHEQVLEPILFPPGGEGHETVRSVSISGNAILFGGGRSNTSGYAQVFRYDGTTWNMEQALKGHVGGAQFFGYSTGIHGNLAAVGGADSGVLMYEWNGVAWKVLPTGLGPFVQPHYSSIAVAESTIATTDPEHEVDGNAKQGAVLVLRTGKSKEAIRLGEPPNPPALQSSSGAIIGETWTLAVDHGAFIPDALNDFIIVSPERVNIPLGAPGTLLCNLASPTAFTLWNTSAGHSFALNAPDNCALIGLEMSAQGGALDSGFAPHLTNAIDVVIGSH